jgi:hypothetical protein
MGFDKVLNLNGKSIMIYIINLLYCTIINMALVFSRNQVGLCIVPNNNLTKFSDKFRWLDTFFSSNID